MSAMVTVQSLPRVLRAAMEQNMPTANTSKGRQISLSTSRAFHLVDDLHQGMTSQGIQPFVVPSQDPLASQVLFSSKQACSHMHKLAATGLAVHILIGQAKQNNFRVRDLNPGLSGESRVS